VDEDRRDVPEKGRSVLRGRRRFEEACQPRHLPWRDARERVNYLALNFFDAFLKGDAAARARLDPAVVNALDDVVLETK
jgi:hypothetical protein